MVQGAKMRKLQGLSPVLEQQSMQQTFGANSFYQSKAKKRIYLNPLERLDFRKKHQLLCSSRNTDSLRIIASVIPRHVTLVKTGQKTRRTKKSRLRGQPRPRRMQEEGWNGLQGKTTSKSPSKTRRSPKLGKKGVRLYLQNLRNKQTKGRKKATWPKKYKPEKSASRSLEFGGAATTTDAATENSPGTLKRANKDSQQSQAKRAKVAGRSTDSEMFLGNSPPTSESLPEDDESLNKQASPGKRPSPRKRASPRRRRMMTGLESLRATNDDKQHTGASKTDEEFVEWLWSESTVESEDGRSPVETEALTPVKMLTSTPKVNPLFTPPVTPCTSTESPRSSLTPTPYSRLLSKPKENATPSPVSRGTRSRRSKVTTPGSRPSPRSSAAWTKMQDKDGMEQMVLDLGQKYFGAVNCDTCGMVYTATHPEDEANHARFHRKYLTCTRFNGWKKEEVLEEFPDGRIIVISPDAPKYAHKKVEEIRTLVDRELGFVEGNSLSGKDLCKTYLFISNDKKIGGCLIAEGISKGYRVIPDKEPPSHADESQKAWCCESEPSSAICGISRIWVAGLTRRKKIASRLMEALRHHFTYGSILAMDDLAFSDPTPDGKLFATSYTETNSFLVYKYT